MSKKLRNYSKIVAFEIAENNITAVEIQFSKNSINITGAFRLNVPVFQNVNHTIELIKQSLKNSKIKTKDVVFGLSMQYFKLSPVTIPKTIPESEISSILIQESNVDVNADAFTYIPLYSTQRQDQDGVFRYDVLGISLPHSLVEISSAIAKKAGLNLISLTPSFLSYGSYFDQSASNNLFATLWISQIRSEVVVWLGREPIYEHLFLTHQLNEQVTQSLSYLQSQIPGAQVSSVYLSGPFLRETNLNQLPFNMQYFSLPPNFLDMAKVLQNISLPELITPLGLALSASGNIPYLLPNMLTSSSSTSSKSIFTGAFSSSPNFDKLKKSGSLGIDQDLVKFLVPSFIILFLSILGHLYISSALVPASEADQSIYSNRVSLAESQLKRVQAFDKTNKILTVKSDYFSELIDKRKPWSKTIKEIGDMTPKGLWIDRVEVRNGNFDVFGRALNVDSVANFSININYTAKYLSNSQIIALRKSSEQGVDIVEFQISAKVNDSPKTSVDVLANDEKKDASN